MRHIKSGEGGIVDLGSTDGSGLNPVATPAPRPGEEGYEEYLARLRRAPASAAEVQVMHASLHDAQVPDPEAGAYDYSDGPPEASWAYEPAAAEPPVLDETIQAIVEIQKRDLADYEPPTPTCPNCGIRLEIELKVFE